MHGVRMRPISSAALLAALVLATPGRARAAEVILYDLVNFQGEHRTLTNSEPSLTALGFDNDVESIRVVSGTWSFHRDDDFQNDHGPPIELGPGDYPDIQQLGFPQDKMSSVRLVADEQPPPPPPERPPAPRPEPQPAPPPEPGPSPSPGAKPVGPPSVPSAHSIRLTGFAIDGRAHQTFDREVTLDGNVTTSSTLRGALLEYRAAEGPLVRNDAGKLARLANAPWETWRAQGSSQFKPITFQLSPEPGEKYVYFQVRGRFVSPSGATLWIASKPHVDSIVLTPQGDASGNQVHNVQAAQIYTYARSRGYTFGAMPTGAAECRVALEGSAVVLTAQHRKAFVPGVPQAGPGQCTFFLFGSKELKPGWEFAGNNPRVSPQCASFRREPPVGTSPSTQVDFITGFGPQCSPSHARFETIRIRGPVGFGWQAAFR